MTLPLFREHEVLIKMSIHSRSYFESEITMFLSELSSKLKNVTVNKPGFADTCFKTP